MLFSLCAILCYKRYFLCALFYVVSAIFFVRYFMLCVCLRSLIFHKKSSQDIFWRSSCSSNAYPCRTWWKHEPKGCLMNRSPVEARNPYVVEQISAGTLLWKLDRSQNLTVVDIWANNFIRATYSFQQQIHRKNDLGTRSALQFSGTFFSCSLFAKMTILQEHLRIEY